LLLDKLGDHLNIDWNPTNYTPDASITEAANVDDLSAHLKGIDDKLDDIDANHLEQTVTQAAHGFTVGQVIRMQGGIWVLAQANTASNAEAIGVVDEIINVNTFVVVTHGVTNKLSGLTQDTVYYLDTTTPGLLTTTVTSTVGQIAKPILYAKSTTEVYIYDRIGIEVAANDPVSFSENHVITGAEVTAGFFTLTNVPNNKTLVECVVVGGPKQVNLDYANRTATADYVILGTASDEFHFNNNGAGTGLSEHLIAGHELMITYNY